MCICVFLVSSRGARDLPFSVMPDPGVSASYCFFPGVTQTMAGSILTLVVAEPGLPELGRTIEARRLAIWKMIEQFYRHKPPSLKASAGQIRRLVPFLAKLVAAWGPTTHSPEHLLVKKAMMHLFECYKCLSSSSGLPMSHLKSEASSYGQCLKELHEKFPDKYDLKPKLHQFQELCSSSHRPALTWNYRDEDFGGCLSRM